MNEARVGLGIDFHRFGPRGPLVLGGVHIPHDGGLLGHSDADVLVHAVCDALLGAAALGDLGLLFPDTDERYRGVSSLSLLADVVGRLAEGGWSVANVDASVVAAFPRLAPHFPAMRHALAPLLGVAEDRVGLKATTSEGMGALGRGEGIGAWAVALIRTAERGPGR